MRSRRRRNSTMRRSMTRTMRSSRERRRTMTTSRKRSQVRSPRRRENDCSKTSFYSIYPTPHIPPNPLKLFPKSKSSLCILLFNSFAWSEFKHGQIVLGLIQHPGGHSRAAAQPKIAQLWGLGHRSHPGEPDSMGLHTQIILDPIEREFEQENKKMLEVYHRSKEQRYAFDRIYRS